MSEISERIIMLVEEMIACHDTDDFDRLLTLMDKSILEDPDSFLTKEKFEEVCGKIREQLGAFLKVDYIGQLRKTNSIHTLWKAQYSNTDEETLWAARVNLNESDPKIFRMSIS